MSVTQSFNTTTSMGRLTLNMLLSFAQFEREVTAERIRDKIAASKARGMWMGGNPPVGYAPDGRTLKIVEREAAQVRDIFERYLRLGNVRLVAEELIRDRVTTPERVNGKGKGYGGCAWSRGQIYKLLSNPVYLGLIEHRGERFAGLHAPIIDEEVWEQVQAKLAENLQGQRSGAYVRHASLLAGKVVDGSGEPLACEHASKGATRYCYYVTRRGSGDELRVPARELETVVKQRLAAALGDPLALIGAAGIKISPDLLRSLAPPAEKILSRSTIEPLVTRVRLMAAAIEIECDTGEIARLLGIPDAERTKESLTLTVAARLTRSGRVVRLVDVAGAPLTHMPDTSLQRLVVKAHRWWLELRLGELDITALAAREGVKPSYMTRVVRLAFLSPKVTDAVLAGRQSAAATVSELTLGSGVTALWRKQERVLVPAR